ncbi:hypothetical protein [Labrenzia sp. R5_0]|jgi:hypothetical protein|uniref:hypothetical protein n=1 Tax=Labrenzia sp. R5_0 TaxID=2821108 RepID=UPI001ADCEF0D|nr:hypothetical protein [Labrenzia sp. R5_0]MBO9461695.1 hypothetical protein [Labrenzia sp. R5_0]
MSSDHFDVPGPTDSSRKSGDSPRETDSNSSIPIVPYKNHTEKKTGKRKYEQKTYQFQFPFFGGTNSRRRVAMYVDAWKNSSELQPNLGVTIDLPDTFKAEALQVGLSVTSAVDRWIMMSVRNRMRRASHPFLMISVVETDRLFHLHSMVYSESDDAFLNAFYGAWKRLADRGHANRLDFETLFRLDGSGTRIHAQPISDKYVYKATGRRGVLGWQDYMTKSLDKTLASRCQWSVGGAVSISQPIKHLVSSSSIGRNMIRYNLA